MIKRTPTIFLLALIFIMPCQQVTGQLSPGDLDTLVQSAMKSFDVAGVAIAIVKDGKPIFEKGYGVTSIRTNRPVNEHTNFQIASNSKAFTTAALSILIDEGKLSWKDKVKKYLPEFKMYNEYVTENFLVEDLLCHRSGLGLGVGDLMEFPDGSNFTIKDILTNFQYFKPVSAFRTQFDYDNQLYLVAGELIHRVSGISWEEFVQTRILNPLQMNNSYSSLGAVKDKDNIATPHSSETGTIRTIAAFGDQINEAAGGIISNVEDLSKWMIMQLNHGKYGNPLSQQLFSEARQREMWTIHTVTGPESDPRYQGHFGGYGLGWGLNDIKGNMRVGHTGGLPGMLTSVTLIPDMNLGIVILTNTENGGEYLFNAINKSIIDSYLGLSKIDWVDRFSKNLQSSHQRADSVTIQVWQTVEAAKKTPVKTANYIGVYQDNWFGKVEVFLKGNQLWFKSYRSPKLNGPMYFYKENVFAIKWEYQDMPCDALATFHLDNTSKAASIKMKGISPNIDFSFDFQDLDLKRIE